MPVFNTRPAILILPGGGYAWCSRREADPVAMQFLQAGYKRLYPLLHLPK